MKARILTLMSRVDYDIRPMLNNLPQNSVVVAIGSHPDHFDSEICKDANILVNVWCGSDVLAPMLRKFPNIQWIHTIWAGLDSFMCPELTENDQLILTNAKGVFSPPLAEFSLLSMLHFAKNVPRLSRNKSNKVWERFPSNEIRNSTIGIIGYGNIGQAIARLAKPFQPRILALRNSPSLSCGDLLVDEMFDSSQVMQLVSQSDYVICTLPLTRQTHHYLSRDVLSSFKQGSVFINVGRGPVVDEASLIDILSNPEGNIIGAALDVFETEPLPRDSKLWELDNVLLSPHIADVTRDFMNNTFQLCVENVRRFVNNEDLLNVVVDKSKGY